MQLIWNHTMRRPPSRVMTVSIRIRPSSWRLSGPPGDAGAQSRRPTIGFVTVVSNSAKTRTSAVASTIQSGPPQPLNNEGLADATAASPFRLPRLHLGIGEGAVLAPPALVERLAGSSRAGLDVWVEVEEIVGVVLFLQRCQALVVGAIGGTNPVPIVVAEVIHVDAITGEPVQRPPEVTGPADVPLGVRGINPFRDDDGRIRELAMGEGHRAGRNSA